MKVFYAGVNLYGQFSSTIDDLIINKFTEIRENDEQIVTISMALTYNVLTTSKNIYIRGFFNGKPYQNICVDFDVKSIKQVACSENHILILTYDNGIWQLPVIGEGKFKPVVNFISTEIPKNPNESVDSISSIYCGKNMNLAVSENGTLYSIPVKISDEYMIKEAACGQEHGIFVTDDGKVYTWGTGTRGQLGHGNLEDQPTPCLVEALDGIKIIKVAAGGWHCAVLSEDGDLYTWGWNVNGQLGFYNSCGQVDEDIKSFGSRHLNYKESISMLTIPKPVDIDDNLNANVVDVACGIRHTVILLDNESIYGTGLNKYSQLGLKNEDGENICQMTLMKNYAGRKTKINIMCGPYCTAYTTN